ncbi:MAG: sulfatase-like hydrolase/transferase, partial [Acidobacteriota bacterium]
MLARRYGLARGFDVYDDKIDRPPPRGAQLVVHYEERAGLKTVDRAISWLLDQPGQPAMLWVHLWEPHIPYRPPPPLNERYRDDPYQGEVAAIDAIVGRLIDALRPLGRDGNALIAMASDHGEALGDHGEDTHGLFLYDEVMRVPWIVHGPAWGVRRATIEAPVSVVDIAPTLLEMAGIEPLDAIDGLSLAAALRADAGVPARAGVFAESWLPKLDFGWSGLRAVVSGDLKYVEAPRPELYDLTLDPGELDDLHERAAARALDARATLAQLVAHSERL